MRAHLQFFGAADTVTGSRYLIVTESARVLVDCGLQPRVRMRRTVGWEPYLPPHRGLPGRPLPPSDPN